MDKNTTTGLILIGAVVMAFMFLNKPQEPSPENPKTVTNSSVVDSEKTVENATVDSTSDISEISDLDSSDMIIYQKLKEQQQKEDLIERYGLFYANATGEENIFELENDKIKVSFSSQGARITSTQMIEKDENNLFKYKTYNDFINEINKPLSLFEKETSYMSLTIVDNEKVVPIETKDLFFNLVKQNDSLLVFRAYGGSQDKYLEFSYKLSKSSYAVAFDIDYHNIENDIKTDVDLKWSMFGLSTEKLASDERNICTVMYKYFGSTRDYITETSDDEETNTIAALIKECITDLVEDVKPTAALVDSPVRLVAGEGGLDFNLERILKAQNPDFEGGKKVLEVNCNHDLVKKIPSLSLDLQKAVSRILFEQARVLDGEMPANPQQFSKDLIALGNAL